jgi:hypothetical protein
VTRSAEVIPYSAYNEYLTAKSIVDNTVKIASKVHGQQYTVNEVLIDGTVVTDYIADASCSTVDVVLKEHIDTTVYNTTAEAQA